MNTNINLIQDKLHVIVHRPNYVDLYPLQESAPYFLDFAYKGGAVDVGAVLVGALMTFMDIHKYQEYNLPSSSSVLQAGWVKLKYNTLKRSYVQIHM
jgi:hypothetical protein